MRRRKTLLTLLAVAVATLGGLVVTAALRDTDPPQLYVEHAARLPEGQPLQLFVSADEPATFVLEYAGQVVQEVAQEFTFQLPAVAGVHVAHLVATDGAGNATEESFTITGVPPLVPTLQAAGNVTAGDPLGIRVWPQGRRALGEPAAVGADVAGPADPADSADDALVATVADVLVTLNGVTLPTRAVTGGDGQELQALAATTMTVEPTTLELVVTVLDEFGRSATAVHEVVLTPLPVEVEQLQLSAATLSLITPEARELEAAALAGAWARAEPAPLWEEPFAMPIGGVNTSGFGDARRYAQVGPVSFHYGLDLAAPTGTPVHATNVGRVLIAGHYPIKGGFIAVDHGGGVMSYYFHLSRVNVVDGQLVQRGEVIGEVGSEGLSTGPHLHWEMRVHEEATNPLEWVDRVFPGDPR